MCGAIVHLLKGVFLDATDVPTNCYFEACRKDRAVSHPCKSGKTLTDLNSLLLDPTSGPLFLEFQVDLQSETYPMAPFFMGHNFALEKPVAATGVGAVQYVHMHAAYVGGHNGGFQFAKWEQNHQRVRLPVAEFMERFGRFFASSTVAQAAKRYGALFFVPPGSAPSARKAALPQPMSKRGRAFSFFSKYAFAQDTVNALADHQNDKPQPTLCYASAPYNPAHLQEKLAGAVEAYGRMLVGSMDGELVFRGKKPHETLSTCLRGCDGIVWDDDDQMSKCWKEDRVCSWPSINGPTSPEPIARYCQAACCDPT